MTKIIIDPEFAALLPPLADDERVKLEASLRANGCLMPLITWQEKLVDGHHRYKICRDFGIDYDVKELDQWVSRGMEQDGQWLGEPIADRNEAMEWMIENQHGRRNLSKWQLAKLGLRYAEIESARAKKRMSDGGKLSGSGLDNGETEILDKGTTRDKAGEAVGVSGKYIDMARKVVSCAPADVIERLDAGEMTLGRAYAGIIEKEKKPVIENKKEQDVEKPEELVAGEPVTESVPPTVPHIARGESSAEWYTPEDIIARVRATMGEIDLDPASCAAANDVVGAVQYYSADDDGIAQPWAGRVFLNPPYGKGVVDAFAQKTRDEWSRGDVTEMIVLVNNATETAWFGNLVSCAKMICFPSGRVRYWRTDGDSDAPTQGQAILYCGYNEQSFIANFSSLGWLVDVV